MKRAILILLLLAWAGAAREANAILGATNGWNTLANGTGTPYTSSSGTPGSGDTCDLNGKLVTLDTNAASYLAGSGTLTVSGTRSIVTPGNTTPSTLTLLTIPSGANLTYNSYLNNITTKLLVQSGGTLTQASLSYWVTGGGTISAGGTLLVTGLGSFFCYNNFALSVYGSIITSGTGSQSPRVGTYAPTSSMTVYSGGSVSIPQGCLAVQNSGVTVNSGGTLSAHSIYADGNNTITIQDGATVSLYGYTFPEKSNVLSGVPCRSGSGTLGSTWTVNSPSQILSPAIAGGVGGVSYTGTAQAGSAQNRGIQSGGALSIEPFSLLAMSAAASQLGINVAGGCIVMLFAYGLFLWHQRRQTSEWKLSARERAIDRQLRPWYQRWFSKPPIILPTNYKPVQQPDLNALVEMTEHLKTLERKR